MQHTILCYGDSNTWGYIPTNDRNSPAQRYSRKERWTGLLQNLLGENYYVVEEGLNSRTTNLDYQIPPDRNGKTYLPPCLYSHAPIDLVILALGGNDLKKYFNRTAEQIRDGLRELIEIIQSSAYGNDMQSPPKILIISPPKMLSIIEQFTDDDGIKIFEGALKKAETLVTLYCELAKEKNCYFLDISKSITPSSIDGMHFDVSAHKQLSQMIYKMLVKMRR
jgi:lysophospholipase L1-like esterase